MLTDPFDVANVDNYQQPGFLGQAPDFWRSIANFGGNLAAAANARTSGGFLANGTGFAGPFGAAIGQSQQQGLQRGQYLSDIGYRNTLAQGQNIQNLTAAMNLPLAQAQAQLNYRMMTDPQFRQQFMSSMGMPGQTPIGAPMAGGGATAATGDTPQGGSDYAKGIHSLEGSGQNQYWPASQGGPDGDYGFTGATWQEFAKENPQYFSGKSPDEVLAMRKDPQLGATATDWYAAKNAPVLKAAGVDPTPQNLGIAHALGGAGAAGVLKFPDDASLSQAISVTQPNAADAILRENPQYQRMTVGDLKQKYAKLAPPQQPYQVAQAGNGPLPMPGGGAQAPQTVGQQSAPQLTAQQLGQQLLQESDKAMQDANNLEQQRNIVSQLQQRGAMIPMPPGDPTAMRQEAAQKRSSGLALLQAGPEAFYKTQNSPITMRNMVGIPNGDGTYRWVKTPEVATEQDATGATIQGHMLPASPDAPPGTPGTFEPAIDASTGQPVVKQLPKNVQEARDKAYEDFAGKDADAYVAAQNTQGWLEQMDHAADALTKAGGMLSMGPNSPGRISFANNVNDILRTAGLPAAFDQNAIASWEELKKATTTAGFELSSHYEGHARQAAATIENATSAVPSASNSPIGYHVVSAGIKEAAQSAIDAYNYKAPVAAKHGDLNQAEVDFYTKNPPQMYARRAISTVTPYTITSDKELSRYLPGTFVQYKGRIVQVPERAGAPPIPEYLKNAQPIQAAPASP